MATTQKISLRFSLLVLMILVAAFSLIIPHMPNFSPLGAIGLFALAQKQFPALRLATAKF